MKVRVAIWRTLLILLVVILIGAGAIFGLTFNLFLKPISEWGWKPWVIIGMWAVVSLGLTLAAIFASYYEVNKNYVIVQKGTQRLIYNYSDVVYIDERQSEKSKMVCFYTKQGHARYLMFDSKGILYPTMLANCKNRLSDEEFARKYPKVKL